METKYPSETSGYTTLTASIFRLELSKSNKIQVLLDFLLGLLFDSEDGGDTFLRNVGDVYHTTRRYKPEDRIPRSHLYENLKPMSSEYIYILFQNSKALF
jgi:hypothetical protein